MSKKIWYSWEEMRRDVNVLCREIVLDKFESLPIRYIGHGNIPPISCSIFSLHYY